VTRPLIVLNAVLALAIGGLWWLDRGFDESRESARTAASRFHAIADEATPPIGAIGRIELKLPGSGTVWVAEKTRGAWRLPTYRNAFAMPEAVDGFLKSLLDGRGVVAGSLAADAARFGLVPGRILDARLFNPSGGLVLHALAGDVAPGKNADECFVAVAGQDRVLQLASNPWSMARLDPASPFPPFTDTRIIPGALGRPMPAWISFSGPEAPTSGRFFRRDAPAEDLQRTLGKGPRYHWFVSGPPAEQRLEDGAAAAYLQNFLTLSFDEFLGGIEGREAAFANPPLVVTVGYEGGSTDVLTLGMKSAQGRQHLSNGSTGQVFLMSPAKAAALRPDMKALLAAPQSAPTSR
jgi:hypothetical protein